MISSTLKPHTNAHTVCGRPTLNVFERILIGSLRGLYERSICWPHRWTQIQSYRLKVSILLPLLKKNADHTPGLKKRTAGNIQHYARAMKQSTKDK